MKIKSFYLLSLTLLFSIIVQAQQDTSKSIKATDTITYCKKCDVYYFNNKLMRVRDLNPMLNKYNSSAFEFKQYHRRIVPAAVFLFTAITSGVIALTSNKDGPLIAPSAFILFSGGFIGWQMGLSARRHLKKSVSNYNREVIKLL
jgi:hypothetical protein